jgi:hypothetical protein
MFDVVSNELAVVVGDDPAAYRVEAHLPAAMGAPSIPWVVTNPIYVNLAASHRTSPDAEELNDHNRTQVWTADWKPESSADSESTLSRGTLDDGTPVLLWQLSVVGEISQGPYAALRFPVEQQLIDHRGVQLRARADRPMRIWAQLRAPGERGGRRWLQSFYLDRDMRLTELMFDRFWALTDSGAAGLPPLSEIDSLLLVADTMHTLPGTAATISFSDLWLVKQ